MIRSAQRSGARGLAAVALACGGHLAGAAGQTPRALAARAPEAQAVLDTYCIACHNTASRTADLDLEALRLRDAPRDADAWERVVRKLRARHMPPVGLPRPDEPAYEALLAVLTEQLDRQAAASPRPGRTATFRRLNRTEYRNAVRELLAIEIDAEALLPSDEASHGFDNVTVTDLPPLLLERYVAAAGTISRLAVGRIGSVPETATIRVPPDLTQEEHLPGLPLGTRGGVAARHTFPADGEYEIAVRLARDRNEHIEGLAGPHELEVLVDRKRVALFTISPPPRGGDHRNVDAHLKVRFAGEAGPRQIAATFLKGPSLLLQTQRQPYQARFNFYRHPRTQPAIFSVSITGPYAYRGPGDSPSRRRIFVCEPAEASQEEPCARQILRTLITRAYRRPASESDLRRPLEFFRQAREQFGADEGFEAGVERALAAVLVSPRFLFRVEREPPGIAPGTPYRIRAYELASRLSFFLWSSLPDSELLTAAGQGELDSAEGLVRQVRRMLADDRSRSLVENFASQWLHLRNLAAIRPDMRLFPDFDENLRQAFRQETELFLRSVLREDRSVLDLLRADYTFLNERLARHYGIPNVYGSRFRRVELGPASARGGLLRHGSVLTVTSYATRTSPVLRGKWLLENILAMPPPPPPAGVPELKDNTVAGKLSVRERLAEHRANPACAGCHAPMDPLGFALENYDAVGRWRTVDGGETIDASGVLADGSRFEGAAGLEEALVRRPELFVGALAEKLLAFALGRGIEPSDAPAIRQVVRRAQQEDYRFSSLILGIAASAPFQMRMSR